MDKKLKTAISKAISEIKERVDDLEVALGACQTNISQFNHMLASMDRQFRDRLQTLEERAMTQVKTRERKSK